MTQSFKKVVSLMLAVLMVFSVCVTAMAEEATETPKELTALDLGVTDGNDTKLYDDPAGTGDKVFKAFANNTRPNVELADKATGKAIDTVADQYYTVKFDYYLESLTEGAGLTFDLYYGAFSKYDPTVLGSGKQMISSTNSGFSKNFVGDGQWHTMTMTFKAFDAVNTYKDGTMETVTQEVPVYEEDGVTPKLNEDGTPVVETVTKEVEVTKERALPYLYLTWYTSKSLKAYIKNIEIIDEASLVLSNTEIAIGNIINANGKLVRDAGMTSAYDAGNNKVTLNDDGTVSFTLDNMSKPAYVGKAEWANSITPVTVKGKANPYVLETGSTYGVTFRYKADNHVGDMGLCIAYAENTSTASNTTTAVVKKIVPGKTDGWETLTAIFTVPNRCNLKIALTGSMGSVMTLGNITVARLYDASADKAKFYTMNDNSQPFIVAGYVGTDITVVGNNSDNLALGEKFMGWYSDANCVNKVAKFGDATAIYAKYPTTIVEFNHMPAPKHPNGVNTNQGQNTAYNNGIWRIIGSANIGGMIPAYDAAGVPETTHYALKQGVKYEITYYYQAQIAVKEEYTEEVTTTVPKTDDEGNVIYKTDEEGNPIQATDEEGNPLYEEGEPVYEVETEEVTETVTKTRDVWVTEGAGPKLSHTLASSAGVAGGRDTSREHGAFQLPDSETYGGYNPADFVAHTVTITGNVTADKTGICFRFTKSGINFRMDKITIRELSDENFENGGIKSDFTIDYNDGVTESETVSLANGEIYELPTPTREGYIFAGWYKNYRISNSWVIADDIPASFVVGNLDAMGSTYTAKWVVDATERVEFSETPYTGTMSGGDKGGAFSIVNDAEFDAESADGAYAVMNKLDGANIYKVSLFKDDGSRMYAVEGVTYRFTIRYKVLDDRNGKDLEIGVARNITGSYAPAALDNVYDNISVVTTSKVTDSFVTATADFTVKNIYDAGNGITESGFGRLRQQLALRINSGLVYVDYVEVTPIAYTPEYALYIDNADVDVDFQNKTFTITPDEGYEVKVGSVAGRVNFREYEIVRTDENGETIPETCVAGDKVVNKYAALSSTDGYTYSFSFDGIAPDKLNSLVFVADVVEKGSVNNAALIGVSTRAESGSGDTYKSAGIRFRARVSAATVENASEIGFVVVPKAALSSNIANYMAAGGGVERKGIAYNAENGVNVVYKNVSDYVDYQAIVYLTTETGAYDFTETELTVALYITDAEGNTTYVAEYTDSYANRAK